MPSNLLPVHSQQSSRLGSYAGLPIREDTAYSNYKGEEKSGTRKRAEKALDKLQDALRRVLEPEETILYVARAQVQGSGIEQFFLGALRAQVSKGVLIFTNIRLLYLPVNRRGVWRNQVRRVLWGDVQDAKCKGWLGVALRITYRNGSKQAYLCDRRDARKIRVLLDAVLAAGSQASPAEGIVSLCPGCLTALTPSVYQCARCGITSKNEKSMAWFSLFPGGGYFYTGHPVLGVQDLFVGLVLLFKALLWTLISTGAIPPPREPGEAPFVPVAGWITVGFLVGGLLFERWLANRHCRRFVRDFIPSK